MAKYLVTGGAGFDASEPRHGGTSPYAGVVARSFARLQRGEPLIVHGDGGQTRDFIHVDGVARYLEAAMLSLHRKPRHLTVNAFTGQSSLRALVHGRTVRQSGAAAWPCRAGRG